MICGFLIVLAFVLPEQFFRSKYVAQGAILVLVPSLWSVPVHLQGFILRSLSLSLSMYLFLIWFWFLSLIGVLGGLSILIRRNKKAEEYVLNFVERLTVLSFMYMVMGLFGVVTIIFRNLW
jgi:hypothetical protein